MTDPAETEAERIVAAGPLVLFDGVCNLCDASVRFLLRRDRTGALRFAPIQSAAGQRVLGRHGLPLSGWDSFVFLDEGAAYLRSAAVFRVARYLRAPWPLVRIFRFLPRRLTDRVYNLVSLNRYALFGRKAECMVPDAALRRRFLG
jgi:predicted DCC family thiol-disulfide oxidoreductase YuxK